jgi:chorismate dehydratase
VKKLINYDIIITDDGSPTLFSKIYDENCHSLSGATEETNLHYIDGCKIVSASKEHFPLNIFEVGFGTGLGFKLTCIALSDNKEFNFVSTEIDKDLVEYYFTSNKLNYEYNDSLSFYIHKSNNHTLYVFIGNARDSIKNLPSIFSEKFHAIYQDAFSPKRNSILWTTQWFEQLKNIAHEKCIMSTYSSSSSVRKSMVAAGWKLYSGEQFGKKRTSTRAVLIGETEPDILRRLDASPVTTITDDNYKTYTIENTHEKNKNL